MGRSRFDQHVQQIVGPKADLAAGQTNNAGITASKHLDFRPPAQTKLGKLMNLVGMTNDAGDASTLADGKLFQRYGLAGCLFFHDQRRNRKGQTAAARPNSHPHLDFTPFFPPRQGSIGPRGIITEFAGRATECLIGGLGRRAGRRSLRPRFGVVALFSGVFPASCASGNAAALAGFAAVDFSVEDFSPAAFPLTDAGVSQATPGISGKPNA